MLHVYMCVLLLKSGLWHAFELLWRPCASKPQQQTQNFTLVMVASLLSLLCKRFGRKQEVEAQKSMVQSFSTSCLGEFLFT